MSQFSQHLISGSHPIHDGLWRWCVLWVVGTLPWWLPATGTETVQPLIRPAIIPLQEQPTEQPGTRLQPGPPVGQVTDPASPAVPAAEGAAEGEPDKTPASPETADWVPTVDEAAPAAFAAEGDDASINTPEVAAELAEEGDMEWQLEDTDSGDFAVGLGGPMALPGFNAVNPGFSGNMMQGFVDSPGRMSYGDGWFDDLREGLSIGLALTGTYDTNPSRGYGSIANSDEDDFFLTLFGTVEYLSRASTWTYGGRYSGGYSQYFNQSDLSGYFQNAAASLNYDGGPLTATLRLGIDYGSGANRFYETVVNEIRYNYALSARYQYSNKTSLTADFAQRFTRTSGGNSRDTDSLDLGTAALWKYSPLLEFGPGIRYTQRSQSDSQTRSSIGPTLTVNYDLTRKVSLNSRIGMDFADYEDGGTVDPTLFASIGFNYKASQLWNMYLRLLRDSQASFTTAGQFEDTLAVRVGFNRQIRRAVLSMGVGWETRTTETANSNPINVPDREYLTIDTSVGMPVFRNTCQASIFVRYSEQSGGGSRAWDAMQTGFTINRSF